LAEAQTLFLFEGVDVAGARAAAIRGEQIVAFSEAAAAVLREAGIAFSRAIDALSDDPEMVLYRAAADWTQAFGSRALDRSGQTLKDALRHRGTTLWWWAELYLHYNTQAARRVRFLETIFRVVETLRPEALHTHGLTRNDTLLVERFCLARTMGFTPGALASTSPSRDGRSALTAGLLEASKLVATAAKSRREPDERLVPRSVVFVSHAAFWRTRALSDGAKENYEHYFDALLSEAKRLGTPVVTLGVGPQSTFRTRSMSAKWKERLSTPRDDRYVHINRFVTPSLAATALKAFGRALSVRNRFQGSPSLSAAFSHRGAAFDDLSGEDLGLVLLHQVPWAARSLLEFEAAFRDLDPRLVCLYAESSGLGRAATEAARSLSVKTLGIQHGILYPNYYSYERTEEDVAQGTPMPDITATYGSEGVRLLETAFHYPQGRVVATGSPRYDALAAEVVNVKREDRRASLGIASTDKVVLLASRYKGIRDTHKAAGPAFPALLSAISRIERTRLIIKPHPAEPPEAYDADLATSGLLGQVRVIADRSLTDLLPAADVLVTVESLSATEALVAGVPVVVLRHPSNLRDLVASGAAVGVRDDEDPRHVIAGLLEDEVLRQQFRESREAFLRDVAHGVDGHALDRLLGLISRMSGLD
jgi:hypothetical protein